MNNLADQYTHIKGWGIDANPANNPTYPIKHSNGADHERLNYQRPPQQPADIEILHSNERPNLTAAFGTSSPPQGLSGAIRRFAFRYSENSLAHWMPLVLADRINVVESLFGDLGRGHIPNIFREAGWKAQWEHKPAAVVKKVLITAAVTTAIILLIKRSRSKD